MLNGVSDGINDSAHAINPLDPQFWHGLFNTLGTIGDLAFFENPQPETRAVVVGIADTVQNGSTYDRARLATGILLPLATGKFLNEVSRLPAGVIEEGAPGLTAAEAYRYRRVEPNESTRSAVRDAYTGPDGKIYDAVTGREIKPGQPWVMGHKSGYEFIKAQMDAARRGITREQFIREQNNPNIYQPEAHSTSSRGAHEAPSHITLPAGAAGIYDPEH